MLLFAFEAKDLFEKSRPVPQVKQVGKQFLHATRASLFQLGEFV
jgi:hypothetical protein